MLSNKQIQIVIDFLTSVIKDRGRGLITTGLCAKFSRHLEKILESNAPDITMISLAGEPMDILSKAIKSAKIDNPLPIEWFDIVIENDVRLYQNGNFVKKLG